MTADVGSFNTINVRWFFDRQKVANASERASIRALGFAGALVRRIARNSMRRRKGASAPGSPPSAHSGEFKKLILYALEPYAGASVIIGPTARWRTRTTSGRPRFGPLHEFGGMGQRRFLFWDRVEKKRITESGGNLKRLSRARHPDGKRRYIPLHWIVKSMDDNAFDPHYPARPFMRPALMKAIPRLRHEFPRRFNQAFGSNMSYRAAMAA